MIKYTLQLKLPSHSSLPAHTQPTAYASYYGIS